jgi:hypothetical protein
MASVTVDSIAKVNDVYVSITLKVTLLSQTILAIEEDETPLVENSRIEVYSSTHGRGENIFLPPITVKNDKHYVISLTDTAQHTTTLRYYVHSLMTPRIVNTFNGNLVSRVQFEAIDGSNVYLNFTDNDKDFFLNLEGQTYSSDGSTLYAERHAGLENTFDIHLPANRTYRLRASFTNDTQISTPSSFFELKPTNSFSSVLATIELCDSNGTALAPVNGLIPNVQPTGFRIDWQRPQNGDMFQGDIYYFIYELDSSGNYYEAASGITTPTLSLQHSYRTGKVTNFAPGIVYTYAVLAHKQSTLTEAELLLLKRDQLSNSIVTAEFYGLPTIKQQGVNTFNVEGSNVFYWTNEPQFGSYDATASNVSITYENQDVPITPFSHAYFETDESVTNNKLLGRKFELDAPSATVKVTYTMRKNVYALKYDNISGNRSPGYDSTTPTSVTVTMQYDLTLASNPLPSSASSTVNVLYDQASMNATTYGYVKLNETKALIKTNWTVDSGWTTGSKAYLYADVHLYEKDGTDASLLPTHVSGTLSNGVRTSDFANIAPNTYTYFVRSYYRNTQRLVVTTDSPSQTIYVPKMIEKPNTYALRTDSSGNTADAFGTTQQTISIFIEPPATTSYPYNNELRYELAWKIYDGSGLSVDQPLDGLTLRASGNSTLSLTGDRLRVDLGEIGVHLFDNDFLVYTVSNAYVAGKGFSAFTDQQSTVAQTFVLLPPISSMDVQQVHGGSGLQDTLRFSWKSQLTTRPSYAFYGRVVGETAYTQLGVRDAADDDPTTDLLLLQSKVYSYDVPLHASFVNQTMDFYLQPHEAGNLDDTSDAFKIKAKTFEVQPYEILYLRFNHYNDANDMRANAYYSKLSDPEAGETPDQSTNDDGTRTYYSKGDLYYDGGHRHYSNITLGASGEAAVHLDLGVMAHLEQGTITTNPYHLTTPAVDISGLYVLPDYVHVMLVVDGEKQAISVVGADGAAIPDMVSLNGDQDIYLKIVNNAVDFKLVNLVDGQVYAYSANTAKLFDDEVFVDSTTIDAAHSTAPDAYGQYVSDEEAQKRGQPFNLVAYGKTIPDLPLFHAINTANYLLQYNNGDDAFTLTLNYKEGYASQPFKLKLLYKVDSGLELRSTAYVPVDGAFPLFLSRSDRATLVDQHGLTPSKSDVSEFFSKTFDVYALTFTGTAPSFDTSGVLQKIVTFPAQIADFSASQGDQSPHISLSWTDNFSRESPDQIFWDVNDQTFYILAKDPSGIVSYVDSFTVNMAGSRPTSYSVNAPNTLGTYTYYLCWNKNEGADDITANLNDYNFIVEADVVVVQNYQNIDNAYPTDINASVLAVVGNAVPYYFSATWTAPTLPTNTIVQGADILVYHPSDPTKVFTIPLASYDTTSIDLDYAALQVDTLTKFNLLKSLMQKDDVNVDYRINFSYPNDSFATNLGTINFSTKLEALLHATGVTATRHAGNLKVDYAVPMYEGYDLTSLNLLPNLSIAVSGHTTSSEDLVTYEAITNGYDAFTYTINTEDLLQSTPNALVTATCASRLLLAAFPDFQPTLVASNSEPALVTEIYQDITPKDTSGIDVVYSVDQITNLTFVTPPTSVATKTDASSFVKAYIVDFFTVGSTADFSLGYKVATASTDASSSVITPWKGLSSGANVVTARISAATVSSSNVYSYLQYDDKAQGTTYPSAYAELANVTFMVPSDQTIDNGTPSVTFAHDQVGIAWSATPVTFDGRYYLTVRDGLNNLAFAASYTPSLTITTPCAGKLNHGDYSGWTYEVSHTATSDSAYHTRTGTLATFNVPTSETIESTTLNLSSSTWTEFSNSLIEFRQDNAVASSVVCVDDSIPSNLTQVDYAIDFYAVPGTYSSGAELMYQISAAKDHSVPSSAPPLKTGMLHQWNYTVQRKNSNGSNLGPSYTTTTPKTFSIQTSQSLDQITVNLSHANDTLSFSSIVAPVSFKGKTLEVVYAGHVMLAVDSSNNVTNTSHGWLPSGDHDLAYNVYAGSTLVASGTCQTVHVLVADTIEASAVDLLARKVEAVIHSGNTDCSGTVQLIYDVVDVSDNVVSSTDYQIRFKLTNDPGNGTFYDGVGTDTVVLLHQNIGGTRSTKMIRPDGTLSTNQNGFSAGHFRLEATFEHLNAGAVFGDSFTVYAPLDITNSQRISDTTVTLTHGGDKVTSVSVRAPSSFVGQLVDVYAPGGSSLLTVDSSAVITPNTHGVLSSGSYGGASRLSFDVKSASGNATASPLKVEAFTVSYSDTIDGAVVQIVVTRVTAPDVTYSTAPTTLLDSSNNYVIRIDNDVIDVSSNLVFGRNVSTDYTIDFKNSSNTLLFRYAYADGVETKQMWDGHSFATSPTLINNQDLLGVGDYDWTATIQRANVNVGVNKTVPQFHIAHSQRLTDVSVVVAHQNDAIRSVVVTAPRKLKEANGIALQYVTINTTTSPITGALAISSVANTSEGKLDSSAATTLNVDFLNAPQLTAYDSVSQLHTDAFTVLASETIEAAAGLSLVYAYDHLCELTFTTPPKTPHGYTVALTSGSTQTTYDSTTGSFTPSLTLSESKPTFSYVITRVHTPVGTTITGSVSVQAYGALTTFQQEIGVVAVVRVPDTDGVDGQRRLTITSAGFSQSYDLSNTSVMVAGSSGDNTYDASYSIVAPYVDNGHSTNPTILTNFSNISNNILSIAVYAATPLNNLKSKDFTLTLETSHGAIAAQTVTVTTGFVTSPTLLSLDYRDFQTVKTTYVDAGDKVTQSQSDVALEVKKDGEVVYSSVTLQHDFSIESFEPGEYSFTFTATPVHQYQAYGTFTQTGTFHLAGDCEIKNIAIQNGVAPNCSILVKVKANGAKVETITTQSNPSPYVGHDAVNIYVIAIATPDILPEYTSSEQATANAQLSGSVKAIPCYQSDDGFFYAVLPYSFTPANVLAIAASDIGVAIRSLSDGVQANLGKAYFTGRTPFIATFTP